MPKCIALFLLAATLSAQGARLETKTDTSFGSIRIEYGAPSWSEAFAAEMKPGTVWRLGNNDPTTCALKCGLVASEGAVPPGEYKLALRFGSDSSPSLLVYEGSSFWSEGLPTWSIPLASRTKLEAEAKSLSLNIVEKSPVLDVRFGPQSVQFALTACEPLMPYETQFGQAQVKVEPVALPCSQPLSSSVVGVATVRNGEQVMKFYLHLSTEGETSKLTFRNAQALAMPKEKEALVSRIERLTKAAADNPARREAIEKRIADSKATLTKLEESMKAMSRYQTEKTIDGQRVKRESATSLVTVAYERPEGKLGLALGAGEHDHHFEIDPRTFRQAPR